MRLTDAQLQAIKTTFKDCFLKNDSLWLFGSRVDAAQKGGDLDLYIETSDADLRSIAQRKLDFLVELKKQIGEQKIDVIVRCLSQKQILPIYDEVKVTGVRLV